MSLFLSVAGILYAAGAVRCLFVVMMAINLVNCSYLTLKYQHGYQKVQKRSGYNFILQHFIKYITGVLAKEAV